MYIIDKDEVIQMYPQGLKVYLQRWSVGKQTCLQQDLKKYCGEGNVPADPDKQLLRKMYASKNTKLFGSKHFKQKGFTFAETPGSET